MNKKPREAWRLTSRDFSRHLPGDVLLNEITNKCLVSDDVVRRPHDQVHDRGARTEDYRHQSCHLLEPDGHADHDDQANYADQDHEGHGQEVPC